MTPDQYLLSVLAKYRVPLTASIAANRARQALNPLISKWANQYLLAILFSGSYAKGTVVRGGTDLDLFISVSPTTPETLREIYQTLLNALKAHFILPRRQDVSIGIKYQGLKIDIVPGKKRPGNTLDHSLYRSKAGTWIQTNVLKHIAHVRKSGRVNEIRALKIWRQLHSLDFPSFYLELAVIRALSGRWSNQLADNVLTVLDFFANNLTNARIVDPANTNNIVSDDLTVAEKRSIANQARLSESMAYWSQVLW